MKTKTDRYGRTPIFDAVIKGDKDAVIEMLKDNPDVNLRDRQGWTALHFAANSNLTEIACLLIECGADLEIKDNYGNTPLSKAVFASRGFGDVIKLLLSKGADPNNENDYGVSPLALARKIANYDVAQFF